MKLTQLNVNQSSREETVTMGGGFSLVLICPNERYRQTIGIALQEQRIKVARQYNAYPSLDSLLTASETDSDAFLIDIDTDTELAFDLVEAICAQHPNATVMVYARAENSELMVRSMRVGAREFLTDPVSPATLGEALVRAAARRAELASPKRLKGKVLVFWGAKGGSGVTTLASNFAIALMKEAGREVALLDLNLKIGDVGVVLGLEARFTIMDALRNAERLDREFVATLMAHHSSGISVLPASDAYVPSVSVDNGTLERLLGILREQFAYVVVDAGPSLGNQAEVLFQAADTIYLVSQVDIPSLRNAQRFIAHGLHAKSQQIEIVLNRFEPNKLGFDEQRISKALGMTPKWKIPNDFAAVRQSQNTGEPLIQRQTPVTRSLHQMARAACGKPLDDGKKRRRGLFG